tara:strand:+ start:1538 stop:1933 length:396 start_codon:yes stop_codon:yes gene_type:complete
MTNIFKIIKNFFTSSTIHNKEVLYKLQIMDARLMHMEDAILDYRNILIRLVKQGNSIVEVLKEINAPFDDNFEIELVAKKEADMISKQSERQQWLQELAKTFETKIKKLSELEKELEKYKDQITPGQVGES